MSSLKSMWFKKGIVWEVIFILTILYAISTINVLVIAKSIVPLLIHAELSPQVLKYFAEIAFGLAIFLSIYHLTVMIHKPHHKKQ